MFGLQFRPLKSDVDDEWRWWEEMSEGDERKERKEIWGRKSEEDDEEGDERNGTASRRLWMESCSKIFRWSQRGFAGAAWGSSEMVRDLTPSHLVQVEGTQDTGRTKSSHSELPRESQCDFPLFTRKSLWEWLDEKTKRQNRRSNEMANDENR